MTDQPPPFGGPPSQQQLAVVARQAEMLANRLRKTFGNLRKVMARQQASCFRLYDCDIPEVRAVVDWYDGHAVLGVFQRTQTDNLPGWHAAMEQAVADGLGIALDCVHSRHRRTRPQEGERYERLATTGQRRVVQEGPLRFLVNLDDYLDTGLFSDHRITRRWIMAQAAGRDFLNLFCYTGAFTVAAAKGEAASTTSVDTSATYLAWLQDNLHENKLHGPQHMTVRQDVRAFLRDAEGLGQRWDLIFCDPPSFSTRPGQDDFEVQRDHRALVRQCLALLRDGGVLWFSCNHQRFVANLDGFLGVTVQDWTAKSIPADYRNAQVHQLWRLTKEPANTEPAEQDDSAVAGW